MGAVETRSTTLGSHAEGDSERRRALIMGGWSEDNVAANTLESAKAMVAQLRLDIDLSEAFVQTAGNEQSSRGKSSAQC